MALPQTEQSFSIDIENDNTAGQTKANCHTRDINVPAVVCCVVVCDSQNTRLYEID